MTVASACESFIDSKGRSVVNFAPLPGFVDVCSRDELMCYMLTVQFPPSMQTIGVFVSSEEWERLRKGSLIAFSRHLIGQRGDKIRPEKFDEFKTFMKKAGKDKVDWPASDALQLRETISLGVIDESDDMISFGILSRFTPPTNEGLLKQLTMVSVHTVLQLMGETLSLYANEQWMFPLDVGSEPDGESTKVLARRWIECIREKNRK